MNNIDIINKKIKIENRLINLSPFIYITLYKKIIEEINMTNPINIKDTQSNKT